LSPLSSSSLTKDFGVIRIFFELVILLRVKAYKSFEGDMKREFLERPDRDMLFFGILKELLGENPFFSIEAAFNLKDPSGD
jgi:hypothetical protein